MCDPSSCCMLALTLMLHIYFNPRCTWNLLRTQWTGVSRGRRSSWQIMMHAKSFSAHNSSFLLYKECAVLSFCWAFQPVLIPKIKTHTQEAHVFCSKFVIITHAVSGNVTEEVKFCWGCGGCVAFFPKVGFSLTLQIVLSWVQAVSGEKTFFRAAVVTKHCVVMLHNKHFFFYQQPVHRSVRNNFCWTNVLLQSYIKYNIISSFFFNYVFLYKGVGLLRSKNADKRKKHLK